MATLQRFFFDTAFTPAPDVKLLSIALVSEDGASTCHLVVRGDVRQRDPDAPAGANVVSLFGRTPGAHMANLAALGRKLGSYLLDIGEAVSLCYDDKTDWQLLEGALMAGGCWNDVAPIVHARHIAAEISTDGAGPEAGSDAAKRSALDRAKSLRARWLCRPATDTTPYGRLRSFLGYHGADSHGSTLYALLSQSDEWMAQHTTFIQWMLPIAERSAFKQQGPLLTLEEFERLSGDHRVRAGVRLCRDRVLKYLGLDLRAGRLARRPAPSPLEDWASAPGPEDLRVSRMLRSLVLLGFADEARMLYRELEALVREFRTAEPAEQTLAYWRAASFKGTGQP